MANRLKDKGVELLISMWHNEPSLWDKQFVVSYSDADLRKAALERMSKELDGLDIGNCARVFIMCRLTQWRTQI